MSDTAREPIAHLWQHKETGRVYYQGPHDEAPRSTYALIGPLFLGTTIPPRDPTQAMIDAAIGIDLIKTGWRGGLAILWKQMYDAAIAEREGK